MLGRSLALALGLGPLAACAPPETAGTAASPSPIPTAGATASTMIAGTAWAPIATAGTFAAEPASGALIYVSTAAEEIYQGPAGGAIATTADDKGRFRIRVAPGKPLLISAMISGNRRLVGLANPAGPGVATADISLESTYASEFLRRYAARAGRSPGDYDLPSLGTAVAQARAMLDRGDLAGNPDLAPAAIPDLVDAYLIAMASRSKDASDFWARFLGEPPLAVTTVDSAVPDGFTPTAIAVDPAGGIFVASFNSTGVAISRAGEPDPVFRALAASGFMQIVAMTFGPDGKIYFAERVDRNLGGAVARPGGASPEIRLFRFLPSQVSAGRQVVPEEIRLQVPPELEAYMADTSLFTHIEPSDLAWGGGNLYMADIETGLVYEFTPPDGLPAGSSWPGRVHAGRVTGGKPAKGNATGPKLGGAAFSGITGLHWNAGTLLLSDGENAVLRTVSPDGTVTDLAGRAGGPGRGPDLPMTPLEVALNFPQDLAIDAAGRIFVADGDNHRIRVIDQGRMRTLAGGGTRTAGDGDARDVAIGQITRLAFDKAGNLLFNDVEGASVRRLWLQHGL